MDIIHVLDKQTADLIAAGEVVERPSSVIKELVENSVDAGATNIKIEIEKGGASLIRVTDNGKGMSPSDAETAFLKHATSKLHSKADLSAISTLGFRGEALCAISAVSKITMRTKTADEIEGTLINAEYGVTLSKKSIAYVTGTSITVEELFSNVPARLKFLKSESAETAVISSLVESLALSFPSIAFSYTVNGKEKLFTYGKGSLKDAVLAAEGKEFAENILPVAVSTPYGSAGKRISVSGFIGKPLYNKPSRSKQLFYINNRMIRSRIMQNALENGYKSYIMTGRFPVCVLNLTIPFDEVDINVHPGKLEAKFGDERAVYDVILAAVSLALSKDASSPEMKYITAEQSRFSENKVRQEAVKPAVDKYNTHTVPQKQTSEPGVSRSEAVSALLDSFEKRNDESSVKNYDDWTIYPKAPQPEKKSSVSISARDFDDSVPEQEAPKPTLAMNDIQNSNSDEVSFGKYSIKPPEADEQPPEKANVVVLNEEHKEEEVNTAVAEKAPEEQSDTQSTAADDTDIRLYPDAPEYKYIGECFNTYIILEGENELYFIDKHALHERMNFERLKSERTPESQTLLTPLLITLEGDAYSSVIERTEFLNTLGFDIDDFGSGTVAVRAIPVLLSPDEAESVICAFAETLTSDKKFADAELLDEFIYDIACKASIKAGSDSSETELRALAEEYMRSRNKLKYCPHGRPITVTVTKNGIEKNFKRLV